MESTPNHPELPDNEIRVSFKTDVKGAVERIEKAYENFDHVKISGINSGISKLIVILEITKVKIEGLHQINLVETLTSDSTDGSDRQRYSTAYRAELHKEKPKSIPAGYFYQAPYSKDHIEAVRAVKTNSEQNNNEDRPRGGMMRGRGGRGRGGRGRGMRGGNREEGQRGGFQGEQRERSCYNCQQTGHLASDCTAPKQERQQSEGGFRGSRGGRGAPRGSRGGFRGGDAPQGRPQTAVPGTRGTIPGLGKN